jgi:hypothetical protein
MSRPNEAGSALVALTFVLALTTAGVALSLMLGSAEPKPAHVVACVVVVVLYTVALAFAVSAVRLTWWIRPPGFFGILRVGFRALFSWRFWRENWTKKSARGALWALAIVAAGSLAGYLARP